MATVMLVMTFIRPNAITIDYENNFHATLMHVYLHITTSTLNRYCYLSQSIEFPLIYVVFNAANSLLLCSKAYNPFDYMWRHLISYFITRLVS